MSIATEIQNYNDGLLDAYASVETKGGTVPSNKNLENLPAAIESISSGGPESNPYITFSTESGTNSLTLAAQYSGGVNFEYSYDTTTWTTWNLTTPLEFGGATKLYLRGTNLTLGASTSNYTKFKFANDTTLVDCSGRITRLLDYNGMFDYVLNKVYCLSYLFNGCKALRTAPELSPLYITDHCYRAMFSGCTSLTTAPELPATTLANNCYSSMFSNCSSLITAPELPATTLASDCYSGMFQNCTSLTTAPELPATRLAGNCYQNMFSNCSSLITAPELPATTLASSCYNGMFYNCSALTTAPELPATTLVSNCYANMLYFCKINYVKCLATNPTTSYCNTWLGGVLSTGTFVKATGVEWPSGASGIPTGWTVEEV